VPPGIIGGTPKSVSVRFDPVLFSISKPTTMAQDWCQRFNKDAEYISQNPAAWSFREIHFRCVDK